jgi:Na+-transporting NADH:ubiquinone oxidoreductase subunit C
MFTVIMTVICALLLAGMFTFLKPVHDDNEAIYNKKQILGALNTPLGITASSLSNEEVAKQFNGVEQLVVNTKGEVVKGVLAEKVSMEQEEKKPLEDRNYPVYVFDIKGEKYYILSVRGNGLWDKIWGWVALKSDLTTVAGTAFGHKGETPGLGAEIKDNPTFKAKFEGKKIYNEAGEYVSVLVKKGGAAPDDPHAVDAISGATITCNGVTNMLQAGIKMYEPYLKSLKK